MAHKLFKKDARRFQFFPNTVRNPSSMKSAGSDILRVVIENNAEEIQNFRDHDSQTIFEPKDDSE